MKKILLAFCFLLLATLSTFAQESNGVDMATEMRSSGKIYVVVAVLVTVFIGLAFYLFAIDSRLKKIERQQK